MEDSSCGVYFTPGSKLRLDTTLTYPKAFATRQKEDDRKAAKEMGSGR